MRKFLKGMDISCLFSHSSHALAAWVRENMIQVAVWASRSELSCPYCGLLVTE